VPFRVVRRDEEVEQPLVELRQHVRAAVGRQRAVQAARAHAEPLQKQPQPHRVVCAGREDQRLAPHLAQPQQRHHVQQLVVRVATQQRVRHAAGREEPVCTIGRIVVAARAAGCALGAVSVACGRLRDVHARRVVQHEAGEALDAGAAERG
jgi:hypothetical protein